ncbi:hypothetical protein GW846_05830 [Candidatus Gracilibacteria bacterium]|nr:hypothetical protein [Candidatus Gracilibacteria bacterium]
MNNLGDTLCITTNGYDCMIETVIRSYYIFFDEKLKSSTFIVLAIAGVVMTVGSLVGGVSASGLSANTLQISQQYSLDSNIIIIDGVSYKIELTKLNQ